MSVELSFSDALPFKRRPKVNIRIISLALHRVITIGILSTHTLNLDCYPWTNLLDNAHVSPWIRYSIILRVKTTSIPVRSWILSLCAFTGVNFESIWIFDEDMEIETTIHAGAMRGS